MTNDSRIKVKFNSVDEVAKFSIICGRYDFDIDFKADDSHFVVDAKSFIGMITVGVGKVCEVILHTNHKDLIETFREDIERWIVDKEEQVS